MTTKALLIAQTRRAFDGDPEMSLKCSLAELQAEELTRRDNAELWTIGEILYHVASVKIEYCKQGFGRWDESHGRPVADLAALLDLLDRAQAHLLECLADCDEEDLARPLATQYHGESAAQFFSVMIAHDIAHGAQIRALRRAFGTRRGGFYPV